MRRSWLAVTIALVGCSSHHPSPIAKGSSSIPSEAMRHHSEPGVLRGVHFAGAPVVLGSCRVKDRRKCFAATYLVYARLDRGIPRRRPRVAWATFAIADSRWVDPIKHPRRRQTCFTQALFSDDPAADHLPTKPGARVRLRFQVFASYTLPGAPVGEISVGEDERPVPPGTPPSLIREFRACQR